MQGFVVDGHGRHNGNLALDQFLHEGVLFEDGCIRPARRTIEFGHQRRAVFDTDLVHAVLVAVERQQATIAAQADTLQCVQHAVWSE